MTPNIIKAIENLDKFIREESPKNTVNICITFNNSGYCLESQSKNKEALKKHVISMQNLRGELIE